MGKGKDPTEFGTSGMNETDRTTAEGVDEKQQPEKPTAEAGERGAPRKRAKRTRKAHIESIAHLIRSNYESKAGVKKLQRADVQAIMSGPSLGETERTELLDLARADLMLQQTKQLMLLSARIEVAKIMDALREFGRQVLEAHPLFQSKTIATALANPQSMSMETAVATLVSTDAKRLGAEGRKPLPRSQVERCRTNAIHCLLLLLRASQGISLLRIQRCMQKHLWAPKARRHRTEKEKLEVLVMSRDPVAASVTFALLDDEAVTQGQKAAAATRGEQRAQTKAQGLEQRVADLESRLRQTQEQCQALREQLEEATQAHATKDARWRDDHETLKGRTLHRLIEESSLLEEGLHALKRDPPKVRVMIDHAERAIESLKREAEKIRRDTSA